MTAQESLAMDPEANPADLADLAHQKPELQQQIAKNPAAYPGLLEWISSYGTPEGKEAARLRLQGAAGQGVDEQPTAIFTELESPFATETFPTTASDATVIRTPREERSPLQPILAPPVAPPQATPDVGSTAHTPGPAGPPPLPNYGFSSPPPAPPSPHGATRPPLPSAQQPPSRKSSNVGAIIAIVLAAILVVVVTIGAWLLFFRDDSADTSQQDAADARTAELEAELEEEKAARKQLEENQVSQEKLDGEMAALEEEEETSSSTISFPAPANAVSAPWFVSETRNTACQLGAAGTTCTIYQANFSLSAQGCTSAPYTITIPEQGPARWDCTLPMVPNDADGPVLEYSTSSSVGNGACLGTIRGMSCWNLRTGSSFAIARDGFMMGTTGLIPESSFPWR